MLTSQQLAPHAVISKRFTLGSRRQKRQAILPLLLAPYDVATELSVRQDPFLIRQTDASGFLLCSSYSESQTYPYEFAAQKAHAQRVLSLCMLDRRRCPTLLHSDIAAGTRPPGYCTSGRHWSDAHMLPWGLYVLFVCTSESAHEGC